MIYFIGNKVLIPSSIWKESNINECYEYFKDKTEIQLDCETEGFFDFKNKILLLQLGDTENQFVIDVKNTNCNVIKDLIVNPKYLKLGQNIKFDYKFIKFQFGWEINNIYDTFLAECLLTNGLQNRQLGLKALCKKYCSVDLNKEVRGKINKVDYLTDEIIKYSAEDVAFLQIIKEKQVLEINKWVELNNVLQVENDVTSVLGDIEYEGLLLDKDKWLELAKKAEDLTYKYEKDLDIEARNYPSLKKYYSQYQGDLFGNEFAKTTSIKWSSPAQLQKVFKDLGLQVESSGEKEISKYQNTYPIIKLFIDYKKQQKLASTYGEEFLKHINKRTKRIHTEFWQILETNRLSSNNPNVQQIPSKPEYLACFITPEGFKLVGSDFAAQELRLITEGSKEQVWINVFNSGGDLHTEMALKVFDNLKKEDAKKDVEEAYVSGTKVYLRGTNPRFIAKTLNFMLAYGGSEFKLANVLGIDVESAKKIKDKYFAGVPDLERFLASCGNYGKRNGYIRSFKPYSSIRFFDNFNSLQNLSDKERYKILGSIERASKNTPIQATGAIMCKIALVNIKKYISNNNLQEIVKPCLQIHDAIYCYVKEEFAEEWGKIQEDIMVKAGELFIKSIPVKSDTKIMEYWKK
jgi:DNA polymerase I